MPQGPGLGFREFGVRGDLTGHQTVANNENQLHAVRDQQQNSLWTAEDPPTPTFRGLEPWVREATVQVTSWTWSNRLCGSLGPHRLSAASLRGPKKTLAMCHPEVTACPTPPCRFSVVGPAPSLGWAVLYLRDCDWPLLPCMSGVVGALVRPCRWPGALWMGTTW